MLTRIRFSPKLLLAIGLSAWGLVGIGLGLQTWGNMEPCPLCILQRYCFVGIGAFALLSLIPSRALRILMLLLGIAGSAFGLGTAVRHLILQLFPPKFASCLPGLDEMMDMMPPSRWLPNVFHGGGECTEVHPVLGLPIPAWSLMWFAGYTLLFTIIFVRIIRKK